MQANSEKSSVALPRRVKVQEVLVGRYPNGERPLSWDLRSSGVDQVRTDEGEALSLLSDGGQSVPKPGWVLLLTDGTPTSGYRWTLYGLPAAN